MARCTFAVAVALAVEVFACGCLGKGMPLAPQWGATIVGSNQEPFTGTWKYDATAGRADISFLKDASYIELGLKDTSDLAVSFDGSTGDSATDKFVSTFRSACWPGIVHTRNEVLWRAFRAMPTQAKALMNSSVAGEPCEVWNANVTGIGRQWICLGSDGVPRSLLTTADPSFVGATNVEASMFSIQFADVTVGPQSISEPKCAEDMSKCPNVCPGGEVVSLEVLRVTDGEPWGELYSRDTGDFPGSIVGFFRLRNLQAHRKYLEVFSVTANSSWGTFRDCNYDPEKHQNVCVPPALPSMTKLVTRMSGESFQGPCGGRCAENTLVGSYYTFPLEGRCAKDSPIGTSGCTWKLGASKVVHIDCVLSAGKVAEAWSKDYGHAPWPNVQAALRVGIAKCPDARSLDAYT